LTGGESHGLGITAIIDGLPAGVKIEREEINRDLARRQKGYGRGKRMEIERDEIKLLGGLRGGMTTGSPVVLFLENKDWENWKDILTPFGEVSHERRVFSPRPGHADLAGALKYNLKDMRDVLERASARETVSKVAAGSIAKQFLKNFGIKIFGWVVEIGGVKALLEADYTMLLKIAEESDLRCPDPEAEVRMKELIDNAKSSGDSLGGVFEVRVLGVPPGLGSYVQYDTRLDGRLAQQLMSVPSVKAVEIGLGFESARRHGSQVHDEIYYSQSYGFYRKTNNAGGIEGGVTNGCDIILRAAMKPIATLMKPLHSVNIDTKEKVSASVERSDVCAVPAGAVIGEAVVALELADAFLEKFGGDSFDEIKRNYDGYMEQVRQF
jgi:chorismate synthase